MSKKKKKKNRKRENKVHHFSFIRAEQNWVLCGLRSTARLKVLKVFQWEVFQSSNVCEKREFGSIRSI